MLQMMLQKCLISLTFLIFVLAPGCRADQPLPDPVYHPEMFNAARAYQDVVTQVGFGPRYSGSEGHAAFRAWLVDSLEQNRWQTEVLEGSFAGHTIYNIEACRNRAQQSEDDYILLGAHYDTRIFADSDPVAEQRSSPVPGANDGASGVAVLLEIARTLPEGYLDPICLVFFDAEDNGRIMDWDWAVGSQIYAEQLSIYPSAVVIVDMVGDQDQYFPIEQNSDPGLVAEIWGAAEQLGINSFSSDQGYSILDDHTAFNRLGIPALDIIDLDYPYWHTTADTVEHVSAASLKNVGDVLLFWLLGP